MTLEKCCLICWSFGLTNGAWWTGDCKCIVYCVDAIFYLSAVATVHLAAHPVEYFSTTHAKGNPFKRYPKTSDDESVFVVCENNSNNNALTLGFLQSDQQRNMEFKLITQSIIDDKNLQGFQSTIFRDIQILCHPSL